MRGRIEKCGSFKKSVVNKSLCSLGVYYRLRPSLCILNRMAKRTLPSLLEESDKPRPQSLIFYATHTRILTYSHTRILALALANILRDVQPEKCQNFRNAQAKMKTSTRGYNDASSCLFSNFSNSFFSFFHFFIFFIFFFHFFSSMRPQACMIIICVTF